MSSNRRQQLAEIIRKAFINTPRPTNDNIINSSEMEGFAGKKWEDLTLDFIKMHRSNLLDFTDEGFHYFLPAFLTAALLYPQDVDTLVSNLLYNLSPIEFVDGSDFGAYTYELERFKKRMNIFSSIEKSAINTFIQDFKEIYPNESWAVLATEEKRLNRSIEFWKHIDSP